MPSESERQRQTELDVARILTIIEQMANQIDAMAKTVSAFAEGAKPLPQCRENARRLDELGKKISQHSYNDLNHRVAMLEKWHGEQKAEHKWWYRQIVGPVIGAAIGGLLAYFGTKG